MLPQFDKIVNSNYEPVPDNCSELIKNLIPQMLNANPELRPSIGQILEIPEIAFHAE